MTYSEKLSLYESQMNTCPEEIMAALDALWDEPPFKRGGHPPSHMFNFYGGQSKPAWALEHCKEWIPMMKKRLELFLLEKETSSPDSVITFQKEKKKGFIRKAAETVVEVTAPWVKASSEGIVEGLK